MKNRKRKGEEDGKGEKEEESERMLLDTRVGKKILKVNNSDIYRCIYCGKYSGMGIIPNTSLYKSIYLE